MESTRSQCFVAHHDVIDHNTVLQPGSRALTAKRGGSSPVAFFTDLIIGKRTQAFACGLVGLVILNLLLDILEYLQCTVIPASDYTLTGPTMGEYMIFIDLRQ